ncbi:DUF3828 domain-containing protein [Lelliottia aquatilis]|uniref:DUF3828 domain-containing protein n=1 Tax=Lelliottia aquatilis TaxID=2080838 RepID=UPI003B8A86E1
MKYSGAEMKIVVMACLFFPWFASAAQALSPESTAALNFNKCYISQIMSGKEPLSDYTALKPYVTRETISKLKAMDKLDPNEYDVPDIDMFIKAQGYQNDWKNVAVVGSDYDAACIQVYIAYGEKKDHIVIDCMVKEDNTWKLQSVAARDFN